MRAFLRGQRVALLALPVLLVLAVLASGQRVVELWWPYEMLERVALDGRGTAHFSTTTETQSAGMVPVELSVRHVETRPADAVELLGGEQVPVPPGLDAWRVRVHVEAAPTTVLTTCQVLLRDTRGREYASGTTALAGGVADLASCQPGGDVVNPTVFDMDADRESTRPPQYDRDAVFLLPEGAVPEVVRVSPDLHLYADWPLASDGG
ncbi:hypothetical protein [Oryzobacter terrae]|uniref:hypothetical protein n=1 Tax=Oryzobacter terrae TaxID=1620385 RepID=UPI00367116D6